MLFTLTLTTLSHTVYALIGQSVVDGVRISISTVFITHVRLLAVGETPSGHQMLQLVQLGQEESQFTGNVFGTLPRINDGFFFWDHNCEQRALT